MAQRDPIADRNDALHRLIASRIREDPSLVARASVTLDAWLQQEPLPAWQEWQDALRFLDVRELADFLESTTPRARRMKISSPFLPLVRTERLDSR